MPIAKSCGLSEYEFWHDNPFLLNAFYEEKEREEHRKAHLQGYYNYIAFSYAMSNAFAKSKADMLEYPREPLSVKAMEMEAQEPITKDNIGEKYNELMDKQKSFLRSLRISK